MASDWSNSRTGCVRFFLWLVSSPNPTRDKSNISVSVPFRLELKLELSDVGVGVSVGEGAKLLTLSLSMQTTTGVASAETTTHNSETMQHHDQIQPLADAHTTVDMDLEASDADGDVPNAHGDPSDAAYARHHATRRRFCARYGRTWVLYSCSREYGYFPMTAHVGPHWPCMLLTYTIAIGPVFLVLLNDDFKLGFRVALLVSSVFSTLVFSMVACSDPGVIYENNQPLTYLSTADRANQEGVICAQCQVRRPKTASHCTDCGVCVNKLDHHCPWTGKCIGTRTLWLFYVFLWSISVHIIMLSVGCTITYLNR